MKSEFGKGLVICLTKFSEHFENNYVRELQIIKSYLKENEKNKELMTSPNPPSGLNYGKPHMDNLRFFMEKEVPIDGSIEKALSMKIELWANGATDHLYEIEVPEQFKRTTLGKKIKMLQDKGLEMGHGFLGKIWTIEDVEELMNLTREIGVLIDKKLGLKPDIGEY